ncbi:ester cyclase [Carboxylicivirga sp. RSCT41]|uniref:ester cyclase n=1 Tax=Carboxylicivirga agarovorans TaxID=3417570 RepID=UPI003D330A94
METKHLTKEESLLKEFQQIKAQEKRNIETTKKCVEYLDKQELQSLRNTCTNDFKLFMGSAAKAMSMDEAIPMIEMFYRAFPDYEHIIENIFASGTYVVMLLTLTGTHKNSFQEVAPTNNRIAYKSIQIYKIVDDMVTEIHAVEDDLTMMTQIGFTLQ